jgi:hypothetical protein
MPFLADRALAGPILRGTGSFGFNNRLATAMG